MGTAKLSHDYKQPVSFQLRWAQPGREEVEGDLQESCKDDKARLLIQWAGSEGRFRRYRQRQDSRPSGVNG